MIRSAISVCFLIVGLWAGVATGQAQSPPPAKPDPQAELDAAFTAASNAQKPGPADIELIDQGVLHLPAGFTFIPLGESQRLLRAMGNSPGADLAGMVFSRKPDDGWMVVIRYVKSGYIKDDDARSWDADELLSQLREGTEQANEDRRSRGIPELEVVGWVAKPAYDSATQRLVWSASTRHKGDAATAGQGVNYNTYALGREGYFSLNLITGLDKIEKEKPVAGQLLAALEYKSGKGYTDFNASTDKVAEYGLAALIGGIAAKKLGLLAAAGVFLLKFWKLLLIGLAVAGGGIAKIFRGRSRSV